MLVHLSADEFAQVRDLHGMMCRWQLSLVVNFSQLCFFNVTECSRGRFLYLHSSATLTEVLPCFSLSCKANSRVKPAKMGHGPHSSKIFVLFCALFVLCYYVYCLYVNVYCTTATGWLPNCS